MASLAYADLIKWFTNRSEGLPAYLIVDMVTQDVEVVRLEEGMKYTPAEHFGSEPPAAPAVRTIPPICLPTPVFEIDEEGDALLGLPPDGQDHRPLRRHGYQRRRAGERRHRRERSIMRSVPSWVDQVYVAAAHYAAV